jgi:hypothetical protein
VERIRLHVYSQTPEDLFDTYELVLRMIKFSVRRVAAQAGTAAARHRLRRCCAGSWCTQPSSSLNAGASACRGPNSHIYANGMAKSRGIGERGLGIRFIPGRALCG